MVAHWLCYTYSFGQAATRNEHMQIKLGNLLICTHVPKNQPGTETCVKRGPLLETTYKYTNYKVTVRQRNKPCHPDSIHHMGLLLLPPQKLPTHSTANNSHNPLSTTHNTKPKGSYLGKLPCHLYARR